ncbi:magnesium transporter [Roseinatronobacter bogoriensis]|uniref:Magnesium transporter MgtE n=1 Tax=Roseinatronobacter bogoriensis subsp. barguzinensis TaxID=441209 RepID=A0A2K8KG05_9RHOB|nr:MULTISPECIES: magnesium transporter [Rhodobaca]ATX66913.1 magnesium transporter [Rhodobaca barguzinensis]MBB4206392.1 magnesium transporter [Rhodobaca bogoriensis DSM 18756]TDW41136.1 magnesium transporter [Rhodobaca barguzinensis]TDY74686.1 magnesium transporter [Rhodobaca bogoriensis DSM 18756]
MTQHAPLSDIRFDPESEGAGFDAAFIAIEVARLLHEGQTDAIREFLESQELADIAALIDELNDGDDLDVLRLLPLHDQAEMLGYLRPRAQVDLATRIPRRELVALMTAMSHDERADLFKQLDEEAQEAILPALSKAEREDLRRLAAYEEWTVGSVMTSDYAVLKPEMTTSQAIEALRAQAIEAETIYYAYIIDEARALIGVVSLRDLLTARPRQQVAEIMDTEPVWVRADDEQEEAARLVARYDLLALPVLDNSDRLVGIVTADDAMDVTEEEVTEDFYKSSIVQPLEMSVADASIALLYRARIFWLVLLVFGNIFSGAGIAYFEDTIAAHLSLLFFLPLLIASGGNAGTQSATLMVRALATGDVRPADFGRLLSREVLIALALGLTMALAVSLIGVWRGGPEIALVVALAMVTIVLMGALIGMCLPFIFAKIDRDPAAASGPLVTSIADVLGVIIYFTIAARLLEL